MDIPVGPGRPVVVTFERLVLTPTDDDDSGGDGIDPRRIPPLRFACAHCTYGDMQLRDVELMTSPLNDGLSIDALRVSTDGFEANADGAWTLDGAGAERTRLDVRLSSDDLGKFLASLGHAGGAGAVRGGVTDVTLAATWDGPPSKFDLQALEGVLHFRAGEGTLTDVSKGTILLRDGTEWSYEGDEPEPYQREHDHLFAAIRHDRPYNEAHTGAVATMTAILGRMATYSGREVSWDEALASDLSLAPATLAWDADPLSLPDDSGRYTIPVPGVSTAL